MLIAACFCLGADAVGESAPNSMLPPSDPQKPDGRATLLLKGERNTGTHFLAAILRRNFRGPEALRVEPVIDGAACPVRQPRAQNSACCWMHGSADTQCEYTPAPAAHIFVVRHPVSWLLAMKEHPFEYEGDAASMSTGEFLRRRFAHGDTSQQPLIARQEYANPIQMWNAKVASYLQLKGHKVILRYEDLFDLHMLNRKLLPLTDRAFALAGNQTTLVYPDDSAAHGLDYFNSADFAAAREKANATSSPSGWLQHLQTSDLQFIESQLDLGAMAAVGYPMKPAQEFLQAGAYHEARSVADLRAGAAMLCATAPILGAQVGSVPVGDAEEQAVTKWLQHWEQTHPQQQGTMIVGQTQPQPHAPQGAMLLAQLRDDADPRRAEAVEASSQSKPLVVAPTPVPSPAVLAAERNAKPHQQLTQEAETIVLPSEVVAVAKPPTRLPGPSSVHRKKAVPLPAMQLEDPAAMHDKLGGASLKHTLRAVAFIFGVVVLWGVSLVGIYVMCSFGVVSRKSGPRRRFGPEAPHWPDKMGRGLPYT